MGEVRHGQAGMKPDSVPSGSKGIYSFRWPKLFCLLEPRETCTASLNSPQKARRAGFLAKSDISEDRVLSPELRRYSVVAVAGVKKKKSPRNSGREKPQLTKDDSRTGGCP